MCKLDIEYGGPYAAIYTDVTGWRDDVRLDVSDGNSTVVVYLTNDEAKAFRKHLKRAIKKAKGDA